MTRNRWLWPNCFLTISLLLCAFSFSSYAVQPSSTVQTVVGQAQIVRLPSDADRVAVGEPKIADYTVIGPRELYVLGKSVGMTNLIYWNKQGKPTMLNVLVGMDIQSLQRSFKDSFPDEKDVRVSAVANTIVLNGYVSNAVISSAVVSMSEAYARNVSMAGQGQGQSQQGGAQSSSVSLQASASSSGANAPRIINLLKVRDAQQVMLEVRIAEISKGLLEKIGLGFFGGSKLANPVYGGDGFRWAVPPTSAGGGLVGWLLANTTGAEFDLKKNDGLIKILAAPTIMAISGQEGSFLVGGKVFLPVQNVSNGTPTVTLQEQDYGVGLKFVPTVLEKGRINLKVAPEVSELSKEPVTIVSSGTTTVLPTFFTRRVSTTVQLGQGQSLVIGGFFRNNVTESISSIPVLGQLPILGALFRSSEFRSDQTELVVVVRPTLVEGTDQKPPLPTDNFVQPTRAEFFLGGRLEGQKAVNPAAASLKVASETPGISSFIFSH